MSNSFTRHALMSALLSREYRATVAWMLRECRVNDFIALTRLSNSPRQVPSVVNSNFWYTNQILRQAEFQICITLPHQWASETCRNRNSFIPTFSGHWSPDPSPRSGSWEPDYDHHDIMLRRQINSVFLCSMFECQILDILWLRNYNQYSKWSKGPRNVKKKT